MLKKSITILILCLTVFTLKAQVNFAEISLRSAKQRATIEDKLIFVDTYAQYCKPCKQMDIEFKNPKLAKYLNKHFIRVKVDMEGEHGLDFKNEYQIVFLPTVMILDKNGNQRYKIDQLSTAEELLAIAKHYKEKYYPDANNLIASNSNSVPAKKSNQSSSVSTKKQSSKKPAANNVSKKKSPVEVVKAPVETKVQSAKTTTNKETQATSLTNVKAEEIETSGNEKIIHVLGQNSPDLPPEILMQEAYLKMEFMDGSHRAAAEKYLATQDDWSTVNNMNFLYDFLYTVNSSSFEYLIANKEKFQALRGTEEVNRTISILVDKELERAFPRPNYEKALQLFYYKDPDTAESAAKEYQLYTYLIEDDTEAFKLSASSYLDENNSTDPHLYSKLSSAIMNGNPPKKELKKAQVYISKAQNLNPSNSQYVLQDAILNQLLGNRKQAEKLAQTALQLAKSNQQNIKEINDFISKLASL